MVQKLTSFKRPGEVGEGERSWECISCQIGHIGGAVEPRCPEASGRRQIITDGSLFGYSSCLQDGDGIYDPFKVPLSIPKQVIKDKENSGAVI